MPGCSGIEFARAGKSLPPLVFVTAHSDFAIPAFALDAVDYLLKPVESPRLLDTMTRVRARIAQLCRHPPSGFQQGESLRQRLGVRTATGIRFFDVTRLTRIRARDKYACFDYEGEEFIVDDSLLNLERRFAEFGFWRVHRSELINLNHVLQLPASASEGDIILTDGQTVRASRRFLRTIKMRLGLLYGDRASLRARHTESGGYRVEVELPVFGAAHSVSGHSEEPIGQ